MTYFSVMIECSLLLASKAYIAIIWSNFYVMIKHFYENIGIWEVNLKHETQGRKDMQWKVEWV